MERLHQLKEKILFCIEGEACNLAQADAKELGEAIDMLKDLEEAIYYATITKAMKENDEKREHSGGQSNEREIMYYPYPMYYPSNNGNSNSMYFPEKGETGHYMIYFDPYRDMDRDQGKMYYNGGRGGNSSSSSNSSDSSSGSRGNSSSGNSDSGSSGGSRGYQEREYPYPIDMRDKREGRSPMSRKMYMESKEMHHGKEAQMKELEKYMQELTTDVTDMIKDASPEEKQLLHKKIATLAEKVGQMNV